VYCSICTGEVGEPFNRSNQYRPAICDLLDLNIGGGLRRAAQLAYWGLCWAFTR
jgi:hypothetical protein